MNTVEAPRTLAAGSVRKLGLRRLALGAAATALLALPATASAATSARGVVLSVSARHHRIQVVDASHDVHAYELAGSGPALATGNAISFRQVGQSISDIQVTGRSHTVSYFASVVKTAGKHLVLRLGDGRTVRLATSVRIHSQRDAAGEILAHAASASTPTVTINIAGLAPGATVLVTEAVAADGSITLTITLPALSTGAGTPAGAGAHGAGGSGGSGTSGGGSGDGGAGGHGGSGTGSGSGSGSGSGTAEPVVQGTVTDVEASTFSVATGSGATLVFEMTPSALANIGMEACDTVFIQYHAAGGALIADNVDDYGSSTTGACGLGNGASDEAGPITAIGATSVTIDTADQGPVTFAVQPASGLTDGYDVGDVVDVTYVTDPDGVTLDATDVEYVETDDLGTVSSIGVGAVTITNAITGQAESFSADPSLDMFDGVEVGDELDVTFHQSSGGQVVDNVDDLTTDGTWTS